MNLKYVFRSIRWIFIKSSFQLFISFFYSWQIRDLFICTFSFRKFN